MPDLKTNYLGLELKNPLVASASPLSENLESARNLERAGVSAIVMYSLFEEQIEHETNEIDRLFSLHHDSFGEATTLLPELDDDNSDCTTLRDLA